ncbi:MAG: DMT family transporter [Nocardioidaceae bacterium]|nr:DMT family transporter [Nocardioidaceae bacterium]
MQWVLALVGVLGVSASGPLMAAIAAPALAIAFWRNGLAAAVLAPVAATTRRGELSGLDRREWWVLMVAAVSLAAHFALWVTALKLTSVASATALVCLMGGWVVLINRFRGEPVSRTVLAGLLVAFCGVLVISGFDTTVSTEAVVGDLLALAGGLFAAVYTIAGGEARRTLSTTAYTSVCYALCAALLLVACLAARQDLGGFSGRTWLGLVAVTACSQLLGHSVFNHLLATMSPTVVSLVILLEVPGAALLAAAFLGQAPPPGVYAGLSLILAGLVIVVATRGPAPRPIEARVD